MSRIPDCRTDEYYNEKYLDEKDSQVILGYDYSIEDNIENFFNNIEIYADDIAYALGLSEESLNIDEDLPDSDKDIEDYEKDEIKDMGIANALLITLKQRMLEWAEINRDEYITSMLDNMNDKEYESLKAKADKGEYKNALVRHDEYMEKYNAGEIPTCWEYKTDENGKMVKIGHCPNGNIVTIDE